MMNDEGIPLVQCVTPRTEKAMPSDFPEEPFLGLDDIEAHTTRLLGTKPSASMKSSAKRFYPGDVLYSRLRPYLNKVWLADRSGLCSSEFIVLPPNEHLDGGFLKYRLNAMDFVSFANSLNAGDRPRVDFDQISSFCIPPFSFARQRRIVAKIEELFSELEAGEESLRLARRQLATYRQSLLKQAFEGKLTAKWRARSPKSASPGWRDVDVSEVLTSKPTNGRSVKDRTGGFRVLRLTAIKGGFIDPRENKEGDWDATDAASHVIRKGNFLLSRGNGSIRLVGRGGIVREDAEIAFPDTMIRLPLNLQLVDPLFFSYLWNSQQVREQIEASARTTAGIYKINQSLLTRYRIRLCPLPEQHEIVRLLDEQFEVIERNEREIDAALQRSEALRQSILHRAFTGKLVPQDPADEPANELLARLQEERAASTRLVKKKSRP